MRENSRPLLAVTMGDPAGIGPEVIVGALASRTVRAACRVLVIGDARIMDRAARWLGRPFSPLVVGSAAEAHDRTQGICLLHLGNADPAAIPVGQMSEAAGRAAADYIVRAVQLARIGSVAGIVTAPISKEALRLAGFSYPGHTEMLAALSGVLESPLARNQDAEGRVAMMLLHQGMRVSHVTTHASVRNACDLITRQRVLAVIRLTDEALRRMGVPDPHIAVAALNPHAGESGLFGDEEISEIAPAIADAARLGLQATGPIPPDSVFARHRAGEFDAVVAMLHDQGHIAIKTLGFAPTRARGSPVLGAIRTGHLRPAGVNLTLGLPFVRTSVDHGTAFDIAGKGTADPTSMVDSILLAAQMARS